MTAGETHQAIEASFRIERARLIAGLACVVRDIDRAEELAQDALIVALAEWPTTGVQANPSACLMAVAKRRAIDALRRDKMRPRLLATCGKWPFFSHGQTPATACAEACF